MEQNPKTVSRDFVFTYVLNFPNTTWKQKSTSKTQDKNEDHILLNLVLQVWKLLLMPFFFFFCYNQQDNYHKSIYLPSSPLFFFQHWHTNHAILTSFLFSQFFWNILFSTVNSFGEVPCWSSTVYNVNCVSASSWGLASHHLLQHLLTKQFEFLSLRS